jgi:hypothetical protein
MKSANWIFDPTAREIRLRHTVLSFALLIVAGVCHAHDEHLHMQITWTSRVVGGAPGALYQPAPGVPYPSWIIYLNQ